MSILRETAKELSMFVWQGDTQLRAEESVEEGEEGGEEETKHAVRSECILDTGIYHKPCG